MSDARTIYTLNAEAAAARCRKLLTTATPPPAGRALGDRKEQPPSIIVEGTVRPYRHRMWSPAGVDQWCAERQPPRIRKALACLDRLEAWATSYRKPRNVDEESLHAAVVEILVAGENEP